MDNQQLTFQRRPADDDPQMRNVAWGFVDHLPLIREALVGMIRGAGSPTIIDAASAHDLLASLADTDLRIDLIMLHVAPASISREQYCREFALLRRRARHIPVVVLSDRMNVGEIASALRAGARGFIPTSWSCTEVMQALKHVQSGGIYVPAEVLSHPLAASRTGAQRDNGAKLHKKEKFTPRQLEVLELLRQGKPNKVIAYELNMQESTVKVHVREIMKKLRVSNRTEAAFRAG